MQGLELRHVLVHGPPDALLVDCQQLEIVGLFGPGPGLVESGLDFGVAGGIGGVLMHAESERAGLDGAGALEAPVVVGDGLSDIALEVTDGGEGFEDDFAVLLIGLLLLRGEDAELAGESVAIRVESATALAFRSGGARGMVRARGVVELLTGHIVFLSLCK